MSDFDKAIEITLKFEGGLSDHVNDKGGLTKYGISQKAYPGVDIRALTLEKAKEIYKRDYWKPNHCDEMLWPVNLCIFDWAVNSGGFTARMNLQHILKVKTDGKVGSKTLATLNLADPIELSNRLLDKRLENYFVLVDANETQRKFLKGWVRRINELSFIVGKAHGKIHNSQNKTI